MLVYVFNFKIIWLLVYVYVLIKSVFLWNYFLVNLSYIISVEEKELFFFRLMGNFFDINLI